MTAHYSRSMDDAALQNTLESACLGLTQPALQTYPVVLASPHSGSDYPPDFVAASRLAPMGLRRSEDAYVDEIFRPAAESLGVPLLHARFPRAYVDVNREAYELDPAMFSDVLPQFVNARSSRVRMGLGTIARIVASGEEIYGRKLRFAEARRRIDELYRPYHRQLRRLLDATEIQFGGYLLIDCHSMPSAAGTASSEAGIDIVLGDCHGAACHPALIEAARQFLSARDFTVTVNAPYAGGFTTAHYGRPALSRHALQIEINRSLYMDERNFDRKPYLADLAKLMTELICTLGRTARQEIGLQKAASATIPRAAE